MPEGHVTHRLAGALTAAFGGRTVGVKSSIRHGVAD